MSSMQNNLKTSFCGMSLNSPIILLSGCVGFGEEYTRIKGFSNSDVLGSAKGWAGSFLYNEKAKKSLMNFYSRKNTLSLNFRKSHVYIWIEKKLKQRPEGIFFGDLSKLIHESLYDDPTPYRRQVKELQKNLYDYLKFLDYDNINIDVPHGHSERLKMF